MDKITPDIVKELRRIMKLTQKELADYLGVVESSIQNWERDYCSPSPMAAEKIRELCQKYGIA